MKNILLTLFILICAFTLYAQEPIIGFQNTIGGGDNEELRAAVVSDDGGFLIGGPSVSNNSGDKSEDNLGGNDFWIVKLNSLGIVEWENTIGGDEEDFLRFAIQTSDEGYIVGGSSSSNISGDKTEPSKGLNDYWIIKINTTGSIEWQKTIGGISNDIAVDILETNDGGYFLGGMSNSNISGDKTENSKGSIDYWVLKLNSSGSIEWQKTIGGNGLDLLNSVLQTTDGGYLLSGHSRSDISGDKTEPRIGNHDFWIVKLDAIGDIDWENTIGGNEGDFPWKIKQTNEGGFIIAGESFSNMSGDKSEDNYGQSDYWIVKLNQQGIVEWENTIGGIGGDGCLDVLCDANGNFLIVGFSDSDISGDKTKPSNGSTDIWLLTLDENGEILEQYSIGGNHIDYASHILRTSDNKLFLGATSWSDISGDKTENSNGVSDFWILTLDNLLDIEEHDIVQNISFYPNPVENLLKLSVKNEKVDMVKIFSSKGILIKTFDKIKNNETIDVSNLASGLYYIQFYSGKNVLLKKFIKE